MYFYLAEATKKDTRSLLPSNTRMSTSKYDRQRLVLTRQGGDLNNFIYGFNSRCLAARDLDELTKSVLFIEELLDMEVVKGLERCHPKTLQKAISAAHTAARNRQSVRSGQLRQMHS